MQSEQFAHEEELLANEGNDCAMKIYFPGVILFLDDLAGMARFLHDKMHSRLSYERQRRKLLREYKPRSCHGDWKDAKVELSLLRLKILCLIPYDSLPGIADEIDAFIRAYKEQVTKGINV